ncbi:hypothetical protein [uncultured Sphingomonas sp.]|uniref:hypothetical protein n=1 Tax=uncultured Sphingomonas sp. TaxID=158754 RepID=UPI002590821C|nr:hypothetical protein [uncultured Sphingomonas sp.]
MPFFLFLFVFEQQIELTGECVEHEHAFPPGDGGLSRRRRHVEAASKLRFDVRYLSLFVIAFACHPQAMADGRISSVNSASQKNWFRSHPRTTSQRHDFI